jgi:hypothetical protein
LAGFTGLVLSVNAALGRPLLQGELGSVGGPVGALAFMIAVLSLTVAIALALFGVLMPQKYRGLGREQLRQFTSPDLQTNSRLWVHQSMLGACADILDQDRPVNDCKVKLTKLVGHALLVGFLGVAGQAITLALYEIGV